MAWDKIFRSNITMKPPHIFLTMIALSIFAVLLILRMDLDSNFDYRKNAVNGENQLSLGNHVNTTRAHRLHFIDCIRHKRKNGDAMKCQRARNMTVEDTIKLAKILEAKRSKKRNVTDQNLSKISRSSSDPKCISNSIGTLCGDILFNSPRMIRFHAHVDSTYRDNLTKVLQVALSKGNFISFYFYKRENLINF